jgi:DNA-binding transcriptional LysR family regulator
MLAWDDLRYFLAIARHRTLSAAARALRVAQPTVGRRLAAFEAQLGARLFERERDGYALTAAGAAMLAHVEQMERDALAAERVTAGRDAGLRGMVRITASEWLVVRVLGPLLPVFVDRYPALTIDLVADARHLDLSRREADIALRPREFEQTAVYQRTVARLGFGLYASDAYLARHGAPRFEAKCAGHVVIAMTDDTGDVARPWLASIAGAARFAVRTNGREAMATMVMAGVGLACLPRVVGDALGLRALATPSPPPDRTLWLGVHRDARTIPRVRAATEFLVEELRRRQPALRPP